MSGPLPPRRFAFAVGALVGAVATAGLCAWFTGAARHHEGAQRAERLAVVPLRAVVAAVERAGGSGDELRRAVASLSRREAGLATVRVVLFDGLSLEASTVPEDTGERAAPRRLLREEKELFDRGQRLRAAVQTNVEEEGGRKEEIEVRPAPGGGLAAAAPVEVAGAIAGFVEIESIPEPPAATGGFLPVLALLLIAPLLALLAEAIAPGRRRLVAAVTLVSLAAAAWIASGSVVARLEADRRTSDAAVAARVRAIAALKGSTGDPAAWDADRSRRPRGVVGASGAIDGVRSAQLLAAHSVALRRLALLAAAAGLLIAGFVGFGGARRVGATLARHREAYLYVTPALVGMLVLVFFPFLYGLVLSFTDANLYNSNQSITELWVGLKHYATILGDFDIVRHGEGTWSINYQSFYWTAGFTIVWTITNVAIGVSVGLLLALVLNTKGLALRPLYRVLLILPWAMPNYITALIWKGMFHQQFGVVNQILQIFGLEPLAWFEHPFTSYLTALCTNGWLSFPFMMVVSLGALQSIPADLYEAARVDGADRWQQFRAITLPSLRPALVPAVILSVVWTFNMFNIIYLVTGGEPAGSTEILITQSFKFAFEKCRYGYAAAYSMMIFLMLLAYGWFQSRVSRATEA